MVRAAKHGSWRAGGRVLARHAVQRGLPPPVDWVTWVPADRRRRAERGGHLPERFARAYARELGLEARGVLVRRPGGAAQRGMGRQERRRNVLDAYRLDGVLARDAARHLGRRVLLVDDVRTTGATLDAAAGALGRAGLEVIVLAVVGVDRHLTLQGRAADGVSHIGTKGRRSMNPARPP